MRVRNGLKLVTPDTAGLEPEALRIPHAEAGMTIGLFGGSFNPPHAGHRLVTSIALRRLGLDQLWWLVTPGNPLKDHGALRPMDERLAMLRDLGLGPRDRATAFEAAHRIRYTADTLALLRRRRPGLRFVWIMGADSLATFHRWQDWRTIVRTFPIAVVDRPGSNSCGAVGADGPRLRPLAAAGGARAPAAVPGAPGLGVPARSALERVLDDPSPRSRPDVLKQTQNDAYLRGAAVVGTAALARGKGKRL